MAYNHEYPYVDPSRYNDDWLLNKMKELIAEWSKVQQDWKTEQEAFESLKAFVNNYFDNLDVQQEINNKLDAMAQDGTLYEIIRKYTDPIITEQNNKITVLESRIDTFTNLPTGSTSGDAELQDIRVGYNGITYPTAGDAVRGQARGLNMNIETLVKNTHVLIGETVNCIANLKDYIFNATITKNTWGWVLFNNDDLLFLNNGITFEWYVFAIVDDGCYAYSPKDGTIIKILKSGTFNNVGTANKYPILQNNCRISIEGNSVVFSSNGNPILTLSTTSYNATPAIGLVQQNISPYSNIYVRTPYDGYYHRDLFGFDSVNAIVNYNNYMLNLTSTNGFGYAIVRQNALKMALTNGTFEWLVIGQSGDRRSVVIYKPITGEINLLTQNSIQVLKKIDGIRINKYEEIEIKIDGNNINFLSKSFSITINVGEFGNYIARFGILQYSTSIMENVYLYNNNEIVTLDLITSTSFSNKSFSNKIWCNLGDSISEMGYWIPNVSAYTGLQTCLNYAASGSEIGGNKNDSFYQRAVSMIDDLNNKNITPDLITIFGGTNDYGHSIELGTVSSSDTSTTSGALNEIIKKIQTAFPKCLIIGIVPLQRNYQGDVPGETKGMGANSIGYTMKDYIDRIVNIYMNNSIDRTNLFTELGLNIYNVQEFTTDGLHPTKEYAENAISKIVSNTINKHSSN